MLDGILFRTGKNIGFYDHCFSIVNHITFRYYAACEILMSSIDARCNLSGPNSSISHVHIEIKHYNLTTLVFRLTESGFDSMFAFNTFSVGKLLVYGIFWILMAKN